jgi:hypothetical protein
MRGRGLVGIALLMMACAHKPPPVPPPPPPPPPPKGDVLRFKAKAGGETKSRVKITIEQETAAAQGDKRGASKPVVLTFTFGEEEKIDAVAADGAMLVTARIVDAVGQGSAGTSPQTVDDMALAFDELKIQFKRQARGEVVSLGLSGLRNPLTEATARQVFNAIFGAQRGQLFPEEHVDVGGNWKTTMAIPASANFDGEVHYDYTYARKSGSIAVILCEGRFEGKKVGAVSHKLSGKSSSEFRFDVAAGKLLSSTVDQITQDEGAVQGQEVLQLGVRQHIRVEWSTEGADKDKDKE